MSEIEIQAIQMKSQSRIKELDAEYRLKDQLDAVQHKRRLAEIQLNNTGKVNVAGASGNVKLESQDKAAYNQSRMIEQKRDRALPLSQLETGPKKETPPAKEGEQAAPSNVENPLPEILK